MEKFLKLHDGRQLCYAEYGDPGGKPVFVFHGNPNSRLIWGAIPEALKLPGVRLIAPDRPGYGRTDFVNGITTLESWPGDVASLADSLGIGKFAVFGASGGGPYALACAWKIPERLTCTGVFASVGPFNSGTDRNINPAIRMMWKFAPRVPGLFRLQMKCVAWLATRHPGLYLKMALKEFGLKDRRDYERLNLAERLRPNRAEAYLQGGTGSWYDAMVPANWPIPLDAIRTRVYLWQGEDDESVPPAMGRHLAAKIPGCEAVFIKGAGHLWIFEHLSEILHKLAGHE